MTSHAWNKIQTHYRNCQHPHVLAQACLGQLHYDLVTWAFFVLLHAKPIPARGPLLLPFVLPAVSFQPRCCHDSALTFSRTPLPILLSLPLPRLISWSSHPFIALLTICGGSMHCFIHLFTLYFLNTMKPALPGRYSKHLTTSILWH